MTWEAFVIAHGGRARAEHLAHVTGAPIEAVAKLRRRGVCAPGERRSFPDLFTLFHGRPPEEAEWPAPRPLKRGGGTYEWLAPEVALLASLVGRLSTREIQRVLTTRLQQVTGDPTAARTRNTVQIRINEIGLQSGDVVGGLSTRQAADIVGRVSLINQAIATGRLATVRVGRRHVIPRAEFDRWRSTREEPPTGWVRLGSLRVPLGLSSDSKLPEYAALGYIPDVVLVKGIGTARGTWYIAPAQADAILQAARDRRPLPWYGKPLPGNVRMMWAKWQDRRHRRCRTCAAIWQGPAPATFEAFQASYTTLTLGQKRHLTVDRTKPKASSNGWRQRGSVTSRMRGAGLTVRDASADLHQPTRWVRGWIRQGLLDGGGLVRDALGGEAVRVTPLGLARLRAVADYEAERADSREWMGVHIGAQHVGVCITTLHHWRAAGEVTVKAGPRGILFDRASLEDRARTYWVWAQHHFTRAAPPAWLTNGSAR